MSRESPLMDFSWQTKPSFWTKYRYQRNTNTCFFWLLKLIVLPTHSSWHSVGLFHHDENNGIQLPTCSHYEEFLHRAWWLWILIVQDWLIKPLGTRRTFKSKNYLCEIDSHIFPLKQISRIEKHVSEHYGIQVKRNYQYIHHRCQLPKYYWFFLWKQYLKRDLIINLLLKKFFYHIRFYGNIMKYFLNK